jgi:hypothetical protein
MRRVVTRFPETDVERIDRLAEKATEINEGATVSRAAMLRALVDHGIRAFEGDPVAMSKLGGAVVKRGRKRATAREG